MEAQKPRYFNRNFIASYIMRAVMIFFLMLTIRNEDWFWSFGCVLMIFVSFLPSILQRFCKIEIPWQLDVLFSIAIIMHFVGELFHLYRNIYHYDIFAHMITSIFISIFAFYVIVILNDNWDDFYLSANAMAFVAALFTVVVGVLWEFLEWLSDYFLGSNLQHGVEDTLRDLAVNTLTALFMGILGIWLFKKGILQRITKDFGKQVYENILKKIGLSMFLFTIQMGLMLYVTTHIPCPS